MGKEEGEDEEGGRERGGEKERDFLISFFFPLCPSKKPKNSKERERGKREGEGENEMHDHKIVVAEGKE